MYTVQSFAQIFSPKIHKCLRKVKNYWGKLLWKYFKSNFINSHWIKFDCESVYFGVMCNEFDRNWNSGKTKTETLIYTMLWLQNAATLVLINMWRVQKAGLAYKINSCNQHNLHRKHSGDLWKILFFSLSLFVFLLLYLTLMVSFDYVVANNCFDVYSIKMNEIVAIRTENCNDIANVYCKSFMLFVFSVWLFDEKVHLHIVADSHFNCMNQVFGIRLSAANWCGKWNEK